MKTGREGFDSLYRQQAVHFRFINETIRTTIMLMLAAIAYFGILFVLWCCLVVASEKQLFGANPWEDF